jgi:hypothetical protein
VAAPRGQQLLLAVQSLRGRWTTINSGRPSDALIAAGGDPAMLELIVDVLAGK